MRDATMWRRTLAAGCWLALSALVGPAGAEGGGFFKNLFVGGEGGEASPSLSAPKAMDPQDAYCPEVDIAEGGTVLRTFVGSAGDGDHLHHQIGFGQLARECTTRADGSVSVKVGIQVRALLGPSGRPGQFQVPVTVALKFNDQPLVSRIRQVAVSVPEGAAQGTASMIEDELIVPSTKAVGYDIVVSLSGSTPRAAKAMRGGAKVKRPTRGGTPEGQAAPRESQQ